MQVFMDELWVETFNYGFGGASDLESKWASSRGARDS